MREKIVNTMTPVSRYVLFAIFGILLAGCNEAPQSDRATVLSALRQLAPREGSGEIVYCYKSGQPMQVIEWVDFQIVSLTWFDKLGNPLLKSIPKNHRCLALEMREDGSIGSIFEAYALVKDGAVFNLQDNCVVSIERWDFGDIISTVQNKLKPNESTAQDGP